MPLPTDIFSEELMASINAMLWSGKSNVPKLSPLNRIYVDSYPVSDVMAYDIGPVDVVQGFADSLPSGTVLTRLWAVRDEMASRTVIQYNFAVVRVQQSFYDVTSMGDTWQQRVAGLKEAVDIPLVGRAVSSAKQGEYVSIDLSGAVWDVEGEVELDANAIYGVYGPSNVRFVKMGEMAKEVTRDLPVREPITLNPKRLTTFETEDL